MTLKEIFMKDDCGCNKNENTTISLKENASVISEGLNYHVKKSIPLHESIYRPESTMFFSLFREARKLLKEDMFDSLNEIDRALLEETEIGEFGVYKGVTVPLDYPMTLEYIQELKEAKYKGKEVQLNKPKRGGSKKFYVYWRNPKTGKIKKISFGMAGGGLRAKLNNPKARKAFSKRMNCPMSKPGTPKYYACRLPRYAKLLGFKTSFTGYW